ncbi:DUF3995 domain-containing protein [Actinokineospora guangxiensis]|uniref:DUF3995 domain-containing protein n=1 Tax=Actinokineospora guangxiensis TaxID=1490288 RepID=A0ABW0EH13_9PSEU
MTDTQTAASAPRAEAPSGGKARTWAGWAGMIWSLVYIPPHLWVAFGGSADIMGIPDPGATEKAANWGASVLCLGAALVSLALVKPWGRIAPRWLLLGIAWGAAVVALLHWGVLSVLIALKLSGVIAYEAQDEYFTVEKLASIDRWNLFVFEPWFLGLGVFLIIGAVQSRRLAQQWKSDSTPALPGWMVATGWARALGLLGIAATLVMHVVWATGSRFLLAPQANTGIGRLNDWWVYDGAVALLCLPAAVLLHALGRPGAGPSGAAKAIAGTITMLGFLQVLWGVFTFDWWIYAVYGPLLTGVGLLFELTVQRAALLAERSPATVGVSAE